jgi:hypothetical protein
LQQAELGGPGCGTGTDEELAVLKGHRLGVLGDVGTHQLSPPAEHHTSGDSITPTAIGDQPGSQFTE